MVGERGTQAAWGAVPDIWTENLNDVRWGRIRQCSRGPVCACTLVMLVGVANRVGRTAGEKM